METIFWDVAGLDVHKQTVVACVRRMNHEGRLWKEVRTFGTATRHLKALRQWLKENQVTRVAMESTGVFWKPVFNLLDSHFEEVLLVNARQIKQVPGRKTDVKDCEWIAQLLQHGLLRGSFVPAREQRELRDLTRHRVALVQQQTKIINRVHAVLQDANIKLSSVATDVLGASGRDMLEALRQGKSDPAELAELARGRLRGKIPELRVALEGEMSEHHRFLMGMLLDQLQYLERSVDQLSKRIEEISRPPVKAAVELLTTISGVGQRTAENVVAEIGTNMSRFPSHNNLASWAGLCPGNNESAGKRKSGKTTKGNRWLRGTLNEAAWAASHTKDTYLSAFYRRLARRRGKKRAIVALSHTLLVCAYHMLSQGIPYHDLGPDHFERLEPERLAAYHMTKLRALGYDTSQLTREAAA